MYYNRVLKPCQPNYAYKLRISLIANSAALSTFIAPNWPMFRMSTTVSSTSPMPHSAKIAGSDFSIALRIFLTVIQSSSSTSSNTTSIVSTNPNRSLPDAFLPCANRKSANCSIFSNSSSISVRFMSAPCAVLMCVL